MNHPQFTGFGVTLEEYNLYFRRKLDEPTDTLIKVVSVGAGLLVCGGILWLSELWGGLPPLLLVLVMVWPLIGVCNVASLVQSRVTDFKKARLQRSHAYPRIKRYEEALEAYSEALRLAERRREAAARERERAEQAERQAAWERQEAEKARRREESEHWLSLSGIEFERELGDLFRHLDYRVEPTATSGDQGVDLILKKDGKTTVVQCKSHKAPVGPAIARELYGSMVSFHADNAILACTGGFTKGVKDFVRGKPIQLISAHDLTSLAEVATKLSRTDFNNAPVCPTFGCNELMVLRTDRRGQSWRCPRYPDCTGERPFSNAPVCPTPGCRTPMVLRTGRHGQFWGCPRYPRCRGTREVGAAESDRWR